MDIKEILVQFIFSLPAILLSIAFSLMGMFTRKPLLLIIGGVLALGPSYFLSGGLHLPTYIAPLAIFVCVFMIYKKKVNWAWILLTPLVLTALYAAYQFTLSLLSNS